MNDVTKRGQHAVVLGASMAGLLAARVLADFYDSVTIVDRDVLPEEPVNRRGVPQGRHSHLLWGRGLRVLEELFAGIGAELIEAGVPACRGELSQVYISTGGHPPPRSGHIENFQLITPSRRFLEWHVRRRVAALANVEVLEGHDIVEPITTATKDRITGAIVRTRPNGSERALEADLVVDATGRGARTPAFLDAMGYAPPTEDHLDVRLTYSSHSLQLPPEVPNEIAVIVGPVPGRPTGTFIFRNENNTAMFTVLGMAGHEPPSEFAQMRSFIEEFTPAHVVAMIRESVPLTDGTRHRMPTSRWRRYDRMRRFPHGLLVMGDAICSFNPIYGQGMTIAALEALALQRCLRRDRGDLAQRFFQTTSKIISDAWQLATGADLTLPEVEGPRPLPVRITNKYVQEVQAAAEHDIVVAERLSNVAGLIDSPRRLMHPAVVARVAKVNFARRADKAAAAPAARRATADR
ncbi:MAG: 2-polyprenyl-6-methoxyphenol hydroxylase-like oxidoreductase [Mycobacterium sp.]